MKCLRLVVGFAFAALAGCSSPSTFDEPVHAIWITRFDTKTAADVQTAIDHCADAGFNHVMFQVRGHGVAHWKSKVEPWAPELGGKDPGYDPLDIACRAAHARGVKLHAWFNVMPSWRGTQPPADPRQLWNAHPDWHWYDDAGKRQPLVDAFYVSLNPCLPEVRAYLVSVARELVANYPIDGLHLDYVRFVDELEKRPDAYPRDAKTLALYRAATGLAPDDDLGAWRRWKADQVTTLVEAIRAMIKDTRPEVALTAAVGSMPEGPEAPHQRDSRAWVERGLLDAVFPMNYTADITQFRSRSNEWGNVTRDTDVAFVNGIQLDPKRSEDVIETELTLSRRETPHFCLFAYANLFPSAAGVSPQDAKVRDARRARLLPLLRATHRPQPTP